MTAMSYLNNSLLIQLNTMDVTVEDLEKALIPVEDEDEAAAIANIVHTCDNLVALEYISMELV